MALKGTWSNLGGVLALMPTEKEKMLAGEFYEARDPQLVLERRHARALTAELNRSSDGDGKLRQKIIKELLGSCGERIIIEPPFYCDYGSNIHLGNNVYFNFNCIILDVTRVDIGDNVLFGPNVQIYTATHPMSAEARRAGLEKADAIRIGSDVWVGGGAIILPGVSIGDRTVIGAGSVVTRSMPEDVFAAWLAGRTAPPGEAGSAVFESQGCAGCHAFTPAGAPGGVGPSLDGLPGQARRAGKRLEAFVRESIVDPDAYVEPGYAPGVMPKTYADLPREQVDALLRYLVDAGR